MKGWVKKTVLLLFLIPGFSLAGEGNASSDFAEELFNILKSASEKAIKETVEEKAEELSGTTKGKISEVKLLERRGDRLVLEVRYRDVKKPEGAFIKAEVLYGGEVLHQFRSSLGQITGKKGSVKLTISQTNEEIGEMGEEEEWSNVEEAAESKPTTIFSDQIRLYIVREENPDKRFGTLLFDLPKTWNGSDAPDVPEEEQAKEHEGVGEQNETITLEEGQETKPSGAAKKPYIPAGTILRPLPPAKPSTPPKQQQRGPSLKPQITPSTANSLAKPIVLAGGTVELYALAPNAKWYSGAGRLPYPGKNNDARGFARRLVEVKVSPHGRMMTKAIETHPQWKPHGWIRGIFPSVTLKNDAVFKSIVGFMQGSHAKDAYAAVYVREGGKNHLVARVHLRPNYYRSLKVNLARWRGKTIQIVLDVHAGNESAQDWVVWVNPRIESRQKR